MGKVFVQDKEELLQLANSIASWKEHSTKEKVNRVKSIASSSNPKSQIGKRHRPDRFCAAKELVAARKAKHKREKARARKAEERSSQQRDSVPGGDGQSKECRQSAAISASTAIKQKRVSFA